VVAGVELRAPVEERDEELRLLQELTRRVHACLPELEALVDGLGALDLTFARAALAERLEATEPELSEGGDIDLRGARHPLLVAQQWERGDPPTHVVPVDVRVPASRPGLVISGPNAGGKTVALETCGLLVLMAQAGCHIPAESGGRLPVCDRILAVIGDEPRARYERALAILRKLEREGKLPPNSKSWIGHLEEVLAALPK